MQLVAKETSQALPVGLTEIHENNNLYYRTKYLQQINSILKKEQAKNVLLVGEHGVGKKSLVYMLAKNQTIYELNISVSISGTKFRGAFEEKLLTALTYIQRAECCNPILFIPNINEIIVAGTAEGSLNASDILIPYLDDLRIIGSISQNKLKMLPASIKSKFTIIQIEPPSEKEALSILQSYYNKRFASHYFYVPLSKNLLAYTVVLAKRYYTQVNLPLSAINLLDSAAAQVRTKNEILTGLTKKDIANTLSLLSGIPKDRFYISDKQKINTLFENLSERVIGQSEAIQAVCKTIKISCSPLQNPKKPIASFLFVGPTGVGKTELAKALSDIWYNKPFIRVDMSEFMEQHAVSNLIGAPTGYVQSKGMTLLEKVKLNPYSLILFDEIEKAHPNVLNLFLQLLDDGRLTDNNGTTVDFTNCIIIMTSNVGTEKIYNKHSIGFSTHENHSSSIMKSLEKNFRPEFINRIDYIISFNSFDNTILHEITKKLIKEEVVKKLSSTKLTFDIDLLASYIISKLCDNDRKYGARPLRRLITNYLEVFLADNLLNGINTGKVTIIDGIPAII